MKTIVLIIWVTLWIPGYLTLYARYFFPDSGRQSESQTRNTRQLRRKHIFAPFYAIGWYLLLFLFLGGIYAEQ